LALILASIAIFEGFVSFACFVNSAIFVSFAIGNFTAYGIYLPLNRKDLSGIKECLKK